MTTAWAQAREEACIYIKRDIRDLIYKIQPILHVLYDDCMALLEDKAYSLKFELYTEMWRGSGDAGMHMFVIRDQLFYIIKRKHMEPSFIEHAIQDLLRLCCDV